MKQFDAETLGQLISQLFQISDKLRYMTGRKFTPDGHLVGSIGEVIAKHIFDLELLSHSTKGYDARKGDKLIEIKATFKKGVAFRAHEKFASSLHCIVVRLSQQRPHFGGVVFNGPIEPIAKALEPRGLASNGQKRISLSDLAVLDKEVALSARLKEVRKVHF